MAEHLHSPSNTSTHIPTCPFAEVDPKASTDTQDILTSNNIECPTDVVSSNALKTPSDSCDGHSVSPPLALSMDNEADTMPQSDSQILKHDNTQEVSDESSKPPSNMMPNTATQNREETGSHEDGDEGQTTSKGTQSGGEGTTLSASVTEDSSNNINDGSTDHQMHQNTNSQVVSTMNNIVVDISEEASSSSTRKGPSGGSKSGDIGSAESEASLASGPKRKPSMDLDGHDPAKKAKLMAGSPASCAPSTTTQTDSTESGAVSNAQLRDLHRDKLENQRHANSERMDVESTSGSGSRTDHTADSSSTPQHERISGAQSQTTKQSLKSAEEEDAEASDTSHTAAPSMPLGNRRAPEQALLFKDGKFGLFKQSKKARDTDELPTIPCTHSTSEAIALDTPPAKADTEVAHSDPEIVNISSDDGVDRSSTADTKQEAAKALVKPVGQTLGKRGTATKPKEHKVHSLTSSEEDEAPVEKAVRKTSKTQPKPKAASSQAVQGNTISKPVLQRKGKPDVDKAEGEDSDEDGEEGEEGESEEDEPVTKRNGKGKAANKATGKSPCARCVAQVKRILKPAQTAALEAEKQKHTEAQQLMRERFKEQGDKYRERVEKEKDRTQDSHEKAIVRLEAKIQKLENLLKAAKESHKQSAEEAKTKLSNTEANAKSTKLEYVKLNRDLTQQRDEANTRSKDLEKSTKQKVKDAEVNSEAVRKQCVEEKKQALREMEEQIREAKPGLSKAVKEKEVKLGQLAADIIELKRKNTSTETKLANSIADMASEQARFTDGKQKVEQAKKAVGELHRARSDQDAYIDKLKERAAHERATAMGDLATVRKSLSVQSANNANMSQTVVTEKRANTLLREAKERAMKRLRELEQENRLLKAEQVANVATLNEDIPMDDEVKEKVEDRVTQQVTVPTQGNWGFSGLN